MTDLHRPSPDTALTVVIPAFKAEATVARTLASVLAQEGVALRVIVVVDGGGDRTAAVVREFGDPRVTLLENPHNLGAQKTRNRGMAAARGEWIMFLDADDYLEGPLLHGLVEAARAGQADLALGPFRIEVEATGKVKRRFTPDFASPADLFWRWFGHGRWQSARSDMVPPCAVVWRRAFLQAIGGWDEEIRRNQDGEVVTRAILKGARLAQSTQGCGVYVEYPHETISTSAAGLESLLLVSDKVLAMDSDVIGPAERRRACAVHDYGIAWRCFDSGRDALGTTALKRSRERGFRGNWGSIVPRTIADLFGLRFRFKVMRVAQRLKRRQAGR